MKQVKKGDYRTRGLEKTAAKTPPKKGGPEGQRLSGNDLRVGGGKKI